MQITLIPAVNEADQKACFSIRHAVFVGEQGVTPQEEYDGEDAHCAHVLALTDGTPVGTARYQYRDGHAKIQRVCVLPPYRGKGVGADLIRFVIEQIRGEGKTTAIRLGSQIHAMAFYRQLGFQEFGDEYLDARIRHMDMELRLDF